MGIGCFLISSSCRRERGWEALSVQVGGWVGGWVGGLSLPSISLSSGALSESSCSFLEEWVGGWVGGCEGEEEAV